MSVPHLHRVSFTHFSSFFFFHFVVMLVYIGVLTIRSPDAVLGSYQKKLFIIDEHAGISIAGLTGDARALSKFMRTESLYHRFQYETSIPIGKLVELVGDKSQISTQFYGRRPYGVGLLVAGYDASGVHLFQTCPSGNVYDYRAVAIGGRSQSAKTYLEKHAEEFAECEGDALVRHALQALRQTTGDSTQLTSRNTAVALVGKDLPFRIYEDENVEPFIAEVEDARGDEEEMDEEPVPPREMDLD
jgi:20S proteasome subunit alpha 6